MNSRPSKSPPVEIAIAVIERKGQYLIAQRPEGASLSGLWEFPGGKVEPGESNEQAACRECFEETGLAVEIVGMYPPQMERYAHGMVSLNFFASRLLDEIDPHPPWKWVAREALAELSFPPGNRHLLMHLLSCQPPTTINV